MPEDIALFVKEAYNRDAGRGTARINSGIMKELELKSGSIIKVNGRYSVPAIVRPGYPEDRGAGIIRIDDNLRRNAGVFIDDRVTIKKVEAEDAEKITLAPTEAVRLKGGEQYLRRLLEDRPVKKGQVIRVEVFDHTLVFQIIKTRPPGIVTVHKKTNIELEEEPPEEVNKALTEKKSSRVSIKDLGGLDKEYDFLRGMVEHSFKYSKLLRSHNIDPYKGVLLHGVSGTGKTLIVESLANEIEVENFIWLYGPEVMDKYQGRSEEKLREIFEEATENTPSIIYIDQLDSIAPRREESGGIDSRIVSQLLVLMDNLEAGKVFLIAETNIPEKIDPALLRPDRIEKSLYIPLPNKEDRKNIFVKQISGETLEIEDLESFAENLAERTEGYTGADIIAICKEAGMISLRRRLSEVAVKEPLEALNIEKEDFEEALNVIKPRLKEEDITRYEEKAEDLGLM